MAGKKTSVYLTDEMLTALKEQDRKLPEVIRAGLGIAPADADLTSMVEEAVARAFTRLTEPAPLDEPPPRPRQRPARPTLPALDRRIIAATENLITSWSSEWDDVPPDDSFVDEVRTEVRRLLEEGVLPFDIERGLKSWWEDPTATPDQLAATVGAMVEGEDRR